MPVRRLDRILLTVSDLERLSAFYEAGLGFQRIGGGERSVQLQLGAQRLELVRAEPAGAPYPQPRSAADPWFQHFAIVVADMPAAYARVREQPGFEPISQGGPQLLPPSTGAITAFKFRDPDGHPLELSYFPPPVRSAEWRNPAPGVVFQGVDHTALAVHDLARSTAFYRDVLGLQVGPLLLNQGPTQARLDGLEAPAVDIQILQPAGGGPHIELLAYRNPAAHAPKPIQPGDLAATRTALSVSDLRQMMRQVEPAGGGVAWDADGYTAVIHDPDHHLLVLDQT